MTRHGPEQPCNGRWPRGRADGRVNPAAGCGRKFGMGFQAGVSQQAKRLAKRTGSVGPDVSVFAVAAGACLLELGRVNRFAVGLAQIHAHQP